MKCSERKKRGLAVVFAAICILEFFTVDSIYAQNNEMGVFEKQRDVLDINGFQSFVQREVYGADSGQEEGISIREDGLNEDILRGEDSAVEEDIAGAGKVPNKVESAEQEGIGDTDDVYQEGESAQEEGGEPAGGPAWGGENTPEEKFVQEGEFAEQEDVAQTAIQADSSSEETLTYGDYNYKISSSQTVVITRYTGRDENLFIPSEIGKKAVSSIAPYAVAGSYVKKVTIPSSVRTIEANAFSQNYSLLYVTVKGKDTLIADSAFPYRQDITFICASNSKAYIYARENKTKILLTDGINLSKAKIVLKRNTIVQNESHDMQIPVTVTINGRKLREGKDYICIWPPYSERNSIGAKKVTVTAADYNNGNYIGSKTAAYQVLPMSSKGLYATKKVTASSIQLTWTKVADVSGYYLYRRNLPSAKYKLISNVSKQSRNTYTDKGLKKNTGYQYRLIPYRKANGKIYRARSTNLTTYTASGKSVVNGKKKAKIKTKDIGLEAAVDTENYQHNWAQTSPISDFFDTKGRYTIAYGDAKYVYIQILNNSSLHVTKTIKIKKKYSLIGSVTGGPDGNYYIVWGAENWKSGNVVLEVSKYNSKGKFIKGCKRYNTGDHMDTAKPFEAGNCAVAFQGNTLVCSYAKQMNNVHQSNDVFCINIKNMKENTKYDNSASHSFDQRVLALTNGDVLFANLGDGHPRGFYLSESGAVHSWGTVPFHFYGGIGYNYTNARLGGIGETPAGIALVGSSAVSMTKKFEREKQQLFIQIVSPVTEASIFSGSRREGTSCGSACTDTGVKWLTKYKNASVGASSMTVMEKGRILALWEKDTGYSTESYYMILSPYGTVLQKATKIGNYNLNDCEEIKYKKGCIYWTTANGKKHATVHKLYIGKFK